MDEELHPNIESLSTASDLGAATAVDVTKGLQASGNMPNLDYTYMPDSKNIEDRRGETSVKGRPMGGSGQLRFAGGSDQLQTPPTNPATPGALSGLSSMVAPNLTSLAMGESAPPLGTLPEQGKVPGTQDPRINQAYAEFGELGASLLPLLAGGSVLTLGRALVRSIENPAIGVAAGATTLTAASTDAQGAKLNPKQKNELLMKREQLKIESEAAKQKAGELLQQELELRRQNDVAGAELRRKEAMDAAEISLNKQKEEQTLQRQHEADLANRPFRDKYPNLATAMSNTGLALAALLPYGTRMYQASKTAPMIKAWEGLAKEAEGALKAKNMDEARILIDQMVSFKKESLALSKTKVPSNMTLNAASAAAPMEFQMLPELMDLSSGSAQAKEKAKDTLIDPVRIPASLIQGVTAATLGAKIPIKAPSTSLVKAQTEGLKKSFDILNKKRK